MKQRFFARTGLILGGLLLLTHWLIAIYAWEHGFLFAYANYWHAPVGTIELFILLVSMTPLWLWCLFRFWNWQGRSGN
jgi:hypothetical protein